MFKLRFKLLLSQMNTFNRALKFLAFYSFNQLPFFPTRAKQNIKLRGQLFTGILHAVRRLREPRSGLLHKNNEKLFSNCPAPYLRGQDRFKQFPTPRDGRTGLVPGVARGGGGGGGGGYIH